MTQNARNSIKVFISHSSKNKRMAGRLSDDLNRENIHVWLDRDELHTGAPLIDELQTAIMASTHFLLLWSKPASESRYVKAEWQAAYDLEKVLVSCLLDTTPLPLFLRSKLFCDMRASYTKAWKDILKTLHGESTAVKTSLRTKPQAALEKQSVIDELYRGQETVLQHLAAGDLSSAKSEQKKLDPVMKDALRRWRSDDIILNLAGYHLKNAYQLKYWNEMSEGRYPSDPMLSKAEQLFHAALGINPGDPSAKNGLGNIYWLRGDLDAAEFFVRHAIAKARNRGFRYEAAEHDLAGIKQDKAALAKRKSSKAGQR